ncbi:4Fe-4S dicluster domain-containing protein [bacterium]|nr:4Fe-4S dicluster domain-containing protein [bacterium]
MTNITKQIRDAGIVGAGGAGFPTHVKAASKVDCVIANGAECEPLIHKDYELMVHYPEEVVRGVEYMMHATGATEGIIGIKEKNTAAIDAIQKYLRSGMRLHLLGDFYPSGDEFILVYESTKRLIPPQGYPLHVGIVVNNVETFYNIARAMDGTPVTEKFISVSGAVKKPFTGIVPVGTTFRDLINLAGGTTVSDYGLFVSGIMMGKLEFDLDQPITKTCAGLIVLPRDHTLITRKSLPEKAMHSIGKSACDQCSYCTELCPRYILGYDIQPHKVMRSLGFTKTGTDYWNQYASLCCACGLCTLYACPESLFPKEACDQSKRVMKEEGITWSGKMDIEPHPMYEGRRTPLKMLVKRLGITEYDHHMPFVDRIAEDVRMVRLPLQQHVGKKADPLVASGERVKRGQTIADVGEGQMGARIHASIDGVVNVEQDQIVINR